MILKVNERFLFVFLLIVLISCSQNYKQEESVNNFYKEELTRIYDEKKKIQNKINLNYKAMEKLGKEIEAIFSRLHPDDDRKYNDFDFNNIDVEFSGESLPVNKLLNEILVINENNEILEKRITILLEKIESLFEASIKGKIAPIVP